MDVKDEKIKLLKDLTGFKTSHRDFNTNFSMNIQKLNLKGINVQRVCEKVIDEIKEDESVDVKKRLLDLLEIEVQKINKVCIRCDGDIIIGSKFCPYCGRKLPDDLEINNEEGD